MKKEVPSIVEKGRIKEGEFGSDSTYKFFGAFEVLGPCGRVLRIFSSESVPEYPWDHVSVTVSNRCPNWQEMCFIKDLFFEDEEPVMQLHPPKSEYINNHEYCLHLWRPTNKEIPLPPSILVGVK